MDGIISCRRAALSLAAILATAFAPAAAAQLSGTVREPGGIPVPEATVALWKGPREIARTFTDAEGNFRFDRDSSREATVLLVRRIGFGPTSISLGEKRTGLVVTIEQLAAPLPEVVTTAARRACPNHEDPQARALWRAMSDQYATHPHNVGVWAATSGTSGEVSAAEVGEVDGNRIGYGGYASTGEVRLRYYRAIARDGYATRIEPGDDIEGRFFHWRYPPLHAELSEHFVERDFAVRHTLGLWRNGDGSFTITFCGRDHSKPYLEGTLSISPDTALTAVRWSFRTPSPHEDAGAEVSFLAPPRRAGIRLLVPLRSVWWRRLGGSKTVYVQDATVYREWYMGPDAMLRDRSVRWSAPTGSGL
ncbi:MAG TPA: carboxypeptidase-like regulatory domain-containing protein [Gemmatimonadaceae bacterium]|nr:carboxypeptidase-like regulatory domain-containing protein [Gemmatimonadaceae bacterium]